MLKNIVKNVLKKNVQNVSFRQFENVFFFINCGQKRKKRKKIVPAYLEIASNNVSFQLQPVTYEVPIWFLSDDTL